MTFLEAAIAILKSSRRPMTVREITDAALNRGLIRPLGKTPSATMSAALYGHCRVAATPRVRREYRPGPTRAARDSVKWVHVS